MKKTLPLFACVLVLLLSSTSTMVWAQGNSLKHSASEMPYKKDDVFQEGLLTKPLFRGNIYASIVPAYLEDFILLTSGLNGDIDFGDILFLKAQYQIGYAVYPGFKDVDDPGMDDEEYRSITTYYNNNYADLGLKIATSYSKARMKFDMSEAEDIGDLHTYGKIINRTRFHSFYVTFGVGNMKRPVNRTTSRMVATDTSENNPVNNVYYRAVNLYNTEFRFGLEYRLGKAEYKHGKWRKAYQDETIFYFKVLVPVKSDLEVYRYENNLLDFNFNAVPVTNGFVAPEMTKSGFLLGLHVSMDYEGLRSYISLETGVMPGIDYEKYLGNMYVALSIGLGFGNIR